MQRPHPQSPPWLYGAVLTVALFGSNGLIRDLQAATDGDVSVASTGRAEIEVSVPPRVSVQAVVLRESSNSGYICVQLNSRSLYVRISGDSSPSRVPLTGNQATANCPHEPHSRSWEVPFQRSTLQEQSTPVTLFLEPV
jgi:hypothetical protein